MLFSLSRATLSRQHCVFGRVLCSLWSLPSLWQNVTATQFNQLVSLSSVTGTFILKATKHSSSVPPKSKKSLFPHLSTIKTTDVDRLLRDGFAIQGQLHTISRSIAYVEHPVDKKRVLIFGTNRNYASHGDIVIVRILPMSNWKVTETASKPIIGTDTTLNPPALVKSLEDDADIMVSEPAGSAEENLESEFTELPSLSQTATESRTRELDSPPSKYFHLFNYKTLGELAYAVDHTWPSEIPENVNLLDPIHITAPLLSPRLIRTGQVLAVAKKNPRGRRLLGQISFFRPRVGRITRNTVPLEPGEPLEGAICLFVPNSTNHPLVKLDPSSIPKAVLNNRALGLSPSYVCQITGWSNRLSIPTGIISEQLGDLNELEPATKQILIEYGLEDNNFLPEHLEGLPKTPDDFRIPSKEYLKRRDFRSCCVFSIDPASAKDIDDALHIRPLASDLYEVGVHIADVSYFVKPGTALDREAADRTTSVYLVQRVIPMLPAILSEHLCSLQPAVDRLAFSVVMKIRTSGEVVDVWFGRSVIRSRAKLSYDQALALMETVDLDNNSEKVKQVYKVLPKPESPFKLEHIREALTELNKIARNLRKQRLQQGALTLQKAKIEFDLPSATFDPDPFDSVYPSDSRDSPSDNSNAPDRTVWPRGYSLQAPGPSHQLIEEWMLAANQAVARRLFEAFVQHAITDTEAPSQPSRTLLSDVWLGALLRRHEAPATKNLKELATLFEANGIDLGDGSSKALSQALYNHNRKLIETGHSDEERAAIMDALSHLVYVRMKMATYFSLDDLITTEPELSQLAATDPTSIFERTWHYGLCVPLYTHFTSPIRRYADLLVHRQLAAILHESEQQTDQHSKLGRIRKSRRVSPEAGQSYAPLSQLALQANWCNVRRMMSRRAQEASQRLFLTACLRDCGPLLMDATVLDFNGNSIKLLLSDFGIIVSCPLKKFLRQVKWEVVMDQKASKKAQKIDSKLDSSGHIPKGHISTQWTINKRHSTDNHAHASTELDHQQLIHLLSVLPCRVYCQPEKLALHAEFSPPDIAATCDTDPSVSPD